MAVIFAPGDPSDFADRRYRAPYSGYRG